MRLLKYSRVCCLIRPLGPNTFALKNKIEPSSYERDLNMANLLPLYKQECFSARQQQESSFCCFKFIALHSEAVLAHSDLQRVRPSMKPEDIAIPSPKKVSP